MSSLRKAKKLIRFGVYAALSPQQAQKSIRQVRQRHSINNLRHSEYVRWFNEQKPSEEMLAAQRKKSAEFTNRPLISVIVPLYNTPEQFLKDCINSVLAQTYDKWELCLVNDASPEEHVMRVVKEYAAKHDNIKYVDMTENQHIAGASNEGIKLATGDFIALLDHDDILQPDALYENVDVMNNYPEIDLIYSDEDKVDERNVHVEPFFKPDWSPDFLQSCNYITHFSVFRKKIIDKIGGFRVGTEGAQDWDLILRFTAETQNIYHIPKIIYSWRKSPTSTASAADSKPYAYINQKRVLRDSLAARKINGSVYENMYLGFWRVRYALRGNPLVSVIIPTKDSYEYIVRCIDSIIEQTSYANFEVIIVDTGSTDNKVHEFYSSRKVVTNNIRVVDWKAKRFNFSAACNYGAQAAKGEYLLFLNNDTEIISSDWIESMLEHAQRSEIGMVGCKLLFPGDNIQHAGVVLRDSDVAIHPFYNTSAKQDIFVNIYLSNIRNTAAVTAACSMVSKVKFDAIGGFNEELRVTYNDVDLCLRLLEAGYYNVYTPYAEIRHFESISVGKVTTSDRDQSELSNAQQYMRKKWGRYMVRDPYYSDSFVPTGQAYQLYHK